MVVPFLFGPADCAILFDGLSRSDTPDSTACVASKLATGAWRLAGPVALQGMSAFPCFFSLRSRPSYPIVAFGCTRSANGGKKSIIHDDQVCWVVRSRGLEDFFYEQSLEAMQ